VLKILHNIYIITRNLVLFRREYGKIKFEDPIISMISSLKEILTGIFKESEELELIELRGLKILFVSRNDLLCIGLIDKDDNVARTRNLLIQLIEEFVSKYSSPLIAWNGCITGSEDFEQRVDEILQIVKFSPNGKKVLSTSDNRTLKLWEVEDRAKVYFSIYTPVSIFPGTKFILSLWAYLNEQKPDMETVASREGTYVRREEKGPILAKEGEKFQALLILPSPFEVPNEMDTIIWLGNITKATFPISVPKTIEIGTHLGEVQIFIDGIMKLRIHFTLEIGEANTELINSTQTIQEIKKYFASYSSKDRVEVMKRIQGFVIRSGADVFMDCLSMNPGEKWAPKIYEEILKSDMLLLFWSLAAKQSGEVRKEWTFALSNRGLDFIQPFPLEDPKRAEPPKELGSLHFNDKYLMILKGLVNQTDS